MVDSLMTMIIRSLKDGSPMAQLNRLDQSEQNFELDYYSPMADSLMIMWLEGRKPRGLTYRLNQSEQDFELDYYTPMADFSMTT